MRIFYKIITFLKTIKFSGYSKKIKAFAYAKAFTKYIIDL